jgi:glutathione S-transferase
VQNSLNFIEGHLAKNAWFAGPGITMADFQMSFAIEALLSRSTATGQYPNIVAYHKRMRARPAYQRAEAKGGPTIMAA